MVFGRANVSLIKEVCPMLRAVSSSKASIRSAKNGRSGLLAVEYAMFGCLAILVVLSLIVAFGPYVP